jgi:hypothetical protein
VRQSRYPDVHEGEVRVAGWCRREGDSPYVRWFPALLPVPCVPVSSCSLSHTSDTETSRWDPGPDAPKHKARRRRVSQDTVLLLGGIGNARVAKSATR